MIAGSRKKIVQHGLLLLILPLAALLGHLIF